MSWWNEAGARVIEPECDEDGYPVMPDYGPRIIRHRDTTGHEPEMSLLVLEGSAFQMFDCECGKRDLWMNYGAHLDDVAPLTESFR